MLFRSENYSYYSAGTEVSATTLKPDWSNDYISINKNNAGSIAYWLGNGTGTELNGTDFAVVSSLIITACDMEYTSATEDRTGGSFWYKIMAADNTTPVITEVETLWDQSTPVNKTYKGTKSVAINLLTGLTKNTTFKLHVWAKNWNGLALGDRYLSNGAADYVATFTTDNATSVDQQTNSNLKISSQSGLIEASFEGTKQVELFSVTGQLIRSATVKNQFTQAVKNGAYMLRVNGETHKVVVR